MENELILNFYDFIVRIETKNDDLIRKLMIDFHYFIYNKQVYKSDLYINANIINELSKLIPKELVATKQSINSVTYDDKNIRYNDYYGKAVTILDKNKNECQICSKETDFLHELVYLVILSRQGKWHDFKGLHKIHAMGISKGNENLIVMMPMKGGKTTLFTSFLNESKIGLISDDTPMCNDWGIIKPFPIRLGVEDKPMYSLLLKEIDSKYKSELNRKQYGLKVLVDLLYWRERCGKVGNKNILVEAIRINSNTSYIKKVGFFSIYHSLVKNMIVGIGLPMVIEYFLESTIKDKFVHSVILARRSFSAFNLALKSRKYKVFLGYDLDRNKKVIMSLFRDHS